MAFRKAAGYNNLPNGAWSPIIYSKKVQLAFRKSSVVNDITNNDYFGEVKEAGDTVHIIKEPIISVSPYSRGGQIQTQDLVDEDYTLVIDQANYFAFKTDEIESSMSHVNWESLASDSAGYRLRDQYDQEVLGYLTGYKQATMHANASVARTAADIPGTKAITSATDSELLAGNILNKGSFSRITTGSAGDHSIPVAPRLPGATSYPTDLVSPLDIFNRAARILNQQRVPKEGRWAVIDPVFEEMLRDEDSRLFQAEWGKTNGLYNGKVSDNLHGFRVYVSENLPIIGNGPGASGTSNQNTDFGVIVFGTNQAVATAEVIRKTEKMRDTDSFGDIIRGLHLYGRKVTRPEAIVTAKWNAA